MKQKTKQWKRTVSLVLSFLMMLSVLPADMSVVNAAEETVENTVDMSVENAVEETVENTADMSAVNVTEETVANTAEETLVNIAGEATVSITEGHANAANPIAHINDGNRNKGSTAGLYNGSISSFSGGTAPYDKPWIQLDFSEDKENIKKLTVVTLEADSAGQADLYQFDCKVYGKSSADESYRELGNGTLSRAATVEGSLLEFNLSGPVTLNSVVVSLGDHKNNGAWPILNEVEIYQGQTVEPDPGPEPGPEDHLENIIEGCTITPFSGQNEHPIEHMHDGNRGTFWVDGSGKWPSIVEFALPAANTKCVKKVVLQFENYAGRSMDVSLQYALNGVTSDLISVNGSAKTAAFTDGYTFEFETPQAMSHLYVTLSNPLENGQTAGFWPAIAEAEIYIDNGAEEEVVLENIAATRKTRVTLEESVNTEENQNAVTDNDSATAAPLRTEGGSGTEPFVEVSFGCNQKMRQFVLEMAEDSSGSEYTYTIYGKKRNDTEYTQVTSGTIGTAAESKRAEISVSDLGISAKEVEYESVKAVFAAANDAANSAIPQLAEFQVWANQASIAEADNENIVWGTTAIRSNCNQDTLGRVVDGNTRNTWTADRYPCYVDIELGGLYDLSQIQVYTPEEGYSQYSLYYSSDGKNYTKLGEKDTKESCPASGEVWDASGARASSVRILMEYHSENAKAVLNEVRVMGTRVGEASEAPFTAPVDFAGSAYDVEVTEQDTIDAVKGIVERNLGAQYVEWFEFSLGAEEEYDYFELEDTADGKVRITGNDGVSMAMGLNHYLKYYCNVSITQVGNQVSMPAAAPAVGTKVHKECKVPVRYAYNYCTMSYSMPFWGEEEWQKELDWLALNGVNTVLDITGQEEVWRRFLDEIGYSHEEIKDYLAGPAFYAWAYMANLSGWGGPVHDSWFTDRVELARKNQLTMRKLGMQPILQGYSGMVPIDIAEKATAQGYTVDSSDVIPQGGWCGFQRPYMLRTTSQTYKNYAQLFYECQKQVYGNVSHYYATDPFHEGGNTGGMSPADVSANVIEQMLVKDPEAVWVIQAWQGNPSAGLMTGLGTNKEHALVLDLYAEKDTHWSDSNYAGGREFQNTPWVYCMLNNFGGRMGLHGHMDNLVSGVVKAANEAQHLTGIGIAPEASQNNPVLYDLLFETVWCDDASAPLQEIDTAAWLKSYVTRRYGAESESAYQAMRILEDTVYKAALNMNGQGAPESYLNARPATSITAASTWGTSVIDYDMEKLEEAAELLLQDYDTLKNSDGYLYDLADVLKQVLSNSAQKYHRAMVDALNTGDLAAFTEASDKFLGLADKVEEVLSTRKEFMLGTWTGQAEALAEGTDDFTEDLYRFNAKAIVTTWGTYGNTEGGGLKDYSNRQWAGLTKDFYRQRWQMWIDYQKEVLAGNSPEALNWFEFEWAWVRDHKSYSAQPSGADLGVLGREILTGYSVTEKTAIASPKLLATAPSAGETPKDVTAEGYHEEANEVTFGDGVVRAEGSEDRKLVADGGHDAFMGRYELSKPVGESDAFDISGSRPFVVSFWIKLDEGTRNGSYSVIGKMNKQYGIQAVRNSGSDYIQMYANAGGGWPTYVSATTDLTDWTYVTALYDGHQFWMSVGADEDSMALQTSRKQGSADFALAQDNGSKFTIGYNCTENSAVTCPGLLSDVKMYSMTAEEAANVTKPENDEAAAALVEVLQEKTPILNAVAHIQTPYTIKTAWSTENGEEVTKFGANTAYTVTAVLTARRGYQFTQESVPSTIHIGEQKVQIDASKVVISESGSTMTVVHTFGPAVIVEVLNPSEYINESGRTAPVKEGYVFAGWYTDESCSKETALKQNAEIPQSAYAKFVDQEVLGVRTQITAGTNDGLASTKMRLVTSVDTLQYRSIGFDVSFSGTTRNLQTRNVYTALTGYDGMSKFNYQPSVFSTVSRYFAAYNVTVMKSLFHEPITVTPKWVTLDGTEVTGKTVEIIISKSASFIKRKPSVTDFHAEESTEEEKLNVSFSLNDEDRAIKNAAIILLDNGGTEICRKDIQSGQVAEKLDTKLTGSYTVKVIATYNQTGKEGEDVTDSILLEEVIEAKPVVKIIKVTSDKEYVEKGDTVTITYEIETNKEECISRICVNDINCIATEFSNKKYSVIFTAGETSGIQELVTSKIIYEGENNDTMEDDIVIGVNHTLKIDVLKDQPEIEKYKQQDDIDNSQVTLNFNITDNDSSFTEGTAVLTKQEDGTTQEKAVQAGENSVSFPVEKSKLYTLEIKASYDRDSNMLEGKDQADNAVTDKVIKTMVVELLPDYQLEVTDIKACQDNIPTSYYEKDQTITVKFNSSNISQFVPEKAVINGKEYTLTREENSYTAQIDGYATSGVQDIVIEKIILDNTKELAVTKDNHIQIEILKDKPTATDFSFTETDAGEIIASFNLIDNDNAITAGKILIQGENGEEIKTQQVVSGKNQITFEVEPVKDYTIKVLATYDLDTNKLGSGENEYRDETILEEVVGINNRMVELKDITGVHLYKQNDTSVDKVTNVNLSDLTNLENYLVKVEMRDLPAFYSKIREYKLEENILKFVLDYDYGVQYNGAEKLDHIEVEYGQVEENTVVQTDLAVLIEQINNDPSGNYKLTTDLDAGSIIEGQAVILQQFSGTLNGNGHTIKNLSRPLFSSLNGATIENLVIQDASVRAYGALAPTMSATTVRNVHLKNVTVTAPGANGTGSFAGITNSNTLLENCSATNVTVGTAKRTGGFIGKMNDTTVRNCYISGKVSSNSDGSGGFIGEAFNGSTIENCYVNVTTNFSGTSGSIGGVIGNPVNALLNNTLSVATSISGDGHGARMFGKYTGTILGSSTNNYELAASNLNSNSSHKAVSEVEEGTLRTKEFYIETLKWDEAIWNLDQVEEGGYPTLKNADPNNSVVERPVDEKLYIPEYSRLKKLSNYDAAKEIAYHNLYKLMPFFDANYLIQDGSKISSTDELNTKLIKAIVPLDNENRMIVGLTDKTEQEIAKIRIIFEDESIQDHLVTYENTLGNVANYELTDLKIGYNYPKYLLKEDAGLVTALTEQIQGYTFEESLNEITSEDEDKRYKENFDNVVKENAREFVIYLLTNVPEYNVSIESPVLESKIRQDLEADNQLKKLLTAYNYFDRMYKIDIGGVTVRDTLFFDGSAFGGTLNPIQATNQFLMSSYRATNQSVNYYNNSIKPYTKKASIADFLEYFIKNFAGYEDVTRWFPENYQGFVYEAPAKDFGTTAEYRAWSLMKRRQEIILATLTMPSDQMYILSVPAQLIVGSIRIYKDDVNNPAEREDFKNWLKTYGDLLGEYYNTTLKFIPDGKNIITRKVSIHYDKRAVRGPIYQDPNTTDDPFVKHFYGMIKRQATLNGTAAYANGTDVYWVANTVFFNNGVGNTGTFTHETAHNQDGYFYLLGYGRRPGAGGECFTDSVVCQRMNIETVHFNAMYNYDYTAEIANNLTQERIDSTEKLEDFYKKQWDAINTIDYIEAQAFLQCSPEVQSKIAKKYVWGTSDPAASQITKALTADEFRAMNLKTVQDLWDNQICIRIGATLNGDSLDNVYWYLPHNDAGVPEAKSFKRNAFEMLSVGGYRGGFVQYMSGASRNDLDAIRKITKDDTMTWEKYQMNKYDTVSQKINSNCYFDTDEMIQMFKQVMEEDAQMGSSVTNTRMLRRYLYLYLQRATNDFRTGIYDEKQVVHISDGTEFVETIKQNPYGKYVLDADIDLTGKTGNTSITDVNFVGELDGNGHTISGIQKPIFNMIKFSNVRDLKLDQISIIGASGGQNTGALARTASYSNFKNIHLVSGEIEGVHYTGGMIGRISSCFVNECTANVSVRATGNYVGGMLGTTDTSSVANSYTLGQVKGGRRTGGLIGAAGNSYVEKCYSNSTVESTYANSSGGFIGEAYNGTHVKNNIAFGRTKNAYKFDGMSASGMFGTNYQNNYEYEESVGTSTLNKAGIDFTGKITSVSTATIGQPEFYQNDLQWNADIWDFTNAEAGGLPKLKNLDSNNVISVIEKTDVSTVEEFIKMQEAPDGIYNIINDIDFSGYNAGTCVITTPFTGKIIGNGHTLSNLTNATLFNNFNGIVENLNIRDFTNTRNVDTVTAFANNTNMATLKNMKFENITLRGTHRTAVVSGTDNSNSIFENISVKNANVTGSGVYVSTFVGRKYSGKILNCYVEGTLECYTTECGGLIGALQSGGQISNVITNVNINRPRSTDARNNNGGLIGNIYNSPSIQNSISLGNMTGFTDASGNEINVPKFTGCTEANIINYFQNCYEVIEATGTSRVTENTGDHLKEISRDGLNDSFYKDTLHFDEKIWDFTNISEAGHPELK